MLVNRVFLALMFYMSPLLVNTSALPRPARETYTGSDTALASHLSLELVLDAKTLQK